MLNSIFHAGEFSLEYVLLTMATALVLGLAVAVLYMFIGSYNKNFVIILAVMPLLVGAVIMIVNGNLGASVAVLGAFGLVRFRSAPGSARDIGFIFFAMVAGLAVGMGYLTLAVILTAFIGLVLILLSKSSFANGQSGDRELKITIPENLDYNGIFDDLFEEYTSSHKLIQVRTTNMGTMYELLYQVTVLDSSREKEFIDELRCRNGNLTIVLGLIQTEKTVL